MGLSQGERRGTFGRALSSFCRPLAVLKGELVLLSPRVALAYEFKFGRGQVGHCRSIAGSVKHCGDRNHVLRTKVERVDGAGAADGGPGVEHGCIRLD